MDERDWLREERSGGRAQYGDPTQRCAWCGAPTTWTQRTIVGGALRRNYCSFSCMSKGDFYYNVAFAVSVSIVAIAVTFWVASFPLATADTLVTTIAFLTIPSFCLWSCVCMGFNGRRREKEQKRRFERI